jgi:CDP-diacylglycerol--glycerol-3-phosphate 3-phosphatidyltransferase
MKLADKFTASRVVVAPLFFLVYFAPRFFPAFTAVSIPILWLLFFGIEVTDMLDGRAARKEGAVTDFGKLFDPFADTFAWLTFFFSFVIDGILPSLIMLLIFYREFAILFLRNLMLRKGVAQGARMGGKVKAICYMATGIVSLAAMTVRRCGLGIGSLSPESFYTILRWTASGFFVLALILSIASFTDYLRVYLKMK